METVTLEEAETRLEELIEWCHHSGEEVIITRAGRPIAKLVAIGPEVVVEGSPSDTSPD